MRQEDKMLLIKDLSARLPYAVTVEHTSGFRGTLHDLIAVHLYNEDDITDIDCGIHFFGDEDCFSVEWFKPYLFPLSSMTEEQKEETSEMFWDFDNNEFTNNTEFVDHHDCFNLIDWLNKNHFDYRGLIEKGLAIDATDKNIY